MTTQSKTNQYDPWKAAGTVPTSTREYYGQILISCVAMVFPGGGQRPEVYDPSRHTKQPFTQITATLDPLPEMQLSRETSCNWQNYSSDWVKITMPSIRQLGVQFVDPDGAVDLRKFDKSWVKFQFVPGFTKNRDPEKPNYKTMEFLKVYKSEAECRKAYLAENTSDAEAPAPATPQSTADPAVESALKFVRSIAENAMKKGSEVPEAVDNFLQQNAAVCAGLKIDSPEIQALLQEFDENPPF